MPDESLKLPGRLKDRLNEIREIEKETNRYFNLITGMSPAYIERNDEEMVDFILRSYMRDERERLEAQKKVVGKIQQLSEEFSIDTDEGGKKDVHTDIRCKILEGQKKKGKGSKNPGQV